MGVTMINEIIQADCIEFMHKLDADFITMTLTDIPYGVVNRSSNGLRDFDKGCADQETFEISTFLEQVIRVTSGSIYIFCSTEQVSELRAGMVEAGLSTRLCIWKKTNPSPVNGQHLWLSGIECCVFGRKKNAAFHEHCKNPVWEFPVERKIKNCTPKPLKLFEYLIKTSSNPDDIIFDPCLGTGTTVLAAKNTGRQFIGIDKNLEMIEIARSR